MKFVHFLRPPNLDTLDSTENKIRINPDPYHLKPGGVNSHEVMAELPKIFEATRTAQQMRSVVPLLYSEGRREKKGIQITLILRSQKIKELELNIHKIIVRRKNIFHDFKS